MRLSGAISGGPLRFPSGDRRPPGNGSLCLGPVSGTLRVLRQPLRPRSQALRPVLPLPGDALRRLRSRSFAVSGDLRTPPTTRERTACGHVRRLLPPRGGYSSASLERLMRLSRAVSSGKPEASASETDGLGERPLRWEKIFPKSIFVRFSLSVN